MKRTAVLVSCAAVGLVVLAASVAYRPPQAARVWSPASAEQTEAEGGVVSETTQRIIAEREYEVKLLVNGRPLDEYYARGKGYVEAIEGAEYEVRITNPLPYRVAVALSVDGLNTIDARQTTAQSARKWVLGPHQTVVISGWQVSQTAARRFEFTTEDASYGQALGKTANLGVITAVFFRERAPIVTSRANESASRDASDPAPAAPAPAPAASDAKAAQEEYAATGMGRRTDHPVEQVWLDLEDAPATSVNIRYEFRPQLVRLGILPGVIYRAITCIQSAAIRVEKRRCLTCEF